MTWEGFSEERILQLAKRPDGIYVHRYRWRDENLANKAERLVREGKLIRTHRDNTYVYYKAAA